MNHHAAMPGSLTTTESHEVGRTIPGHLGQVMEFVTNLGNRRADDGLSEVLSVSAEAPRWLERLTLSRAVKNIPNMRDAVKANKRVP